MRRKDDNNGQEPHDQPRRIRHALSSRLSVYWRGCPRIDSSASTILQSVHVKDQLASFEITRPNTTQNDATMRNDEEAALVISAWHGHSIGTSSILPRVSPLINWHVLLDIVLQLSYHLPQIREPMSRKLCSS